MKSKKSRKSGKASGGIFKTLDSLSDSTRTILIAITMLLIIVPIGIIIINFSSTMNENKERQSEESLLTAVWDRAFQNVEESRVGIQFDTSSTTIDQYNLLREACNKEMEESINKVDVNIDVDVTVEEQLFVDNEGNKQIDKKDDSKILVETGPVYFDNMIMIRYMNNSGELKVTAAEFTDANNTRIAVYNQQNIVQANSRLNESKLSELDEYGLAEAGGSEAISETDYIHNVAVCIEKILMPDENYAKYVDKATKYFSADGKDSIIASKESLKIDKSDGVSMVYAIAGKSDTDKIIKDRIYIKYAVDKNGRQSYVNVIVKLNRNLRIFDIDII